METWNGLDWRSSKSLGNPLLLLQPISTFIGMNFPRSQPHPNWMSPIPCFPEARVDASIRKPLPNSSFSPCGHAPGFDHGMHGEEPEPPSVETLGMLAPSHMEQGGRSAPAEAPMGECGFGSPSLSHWLLRSLNPSFFWEWVTQGLDSDSKLENTSLCLYFSWDCNRK